MISAKKLVKLSKSNPPTPECDPETLSFYGLPSTASQKHLRVAALKHAVAQYQDLENPYTLREIVQQHEHAGVKFTALQSRCAGVVEVGCSGAGRPGQCTPDMEAALLRDVGARQRANGCLSTREFHSKMNSLATNAKTSPPSGVSKATSRRVLKAAKLKDSNLGVGKGLPTSTSRQKACTLEPINAFLSCLEDALEEHPILRLAIQNVITYDESPLNQHADKHKPYEAIYLKDIRKKSGGAARVAAPLAGSKRMTLCESIAADGHVFKPGFFVAGQAPQAAWTAAPYPMHITEDAAKSTVIICTDAGVANTESHLQMLELQCIKPAHERRYKADLNIPLLLIIDNANCHGFDIDFEDMSKEMAELFAKYNVVCVPLPANTSTHLSPLDLRYFGFLKTCLDTTLNDIVQVASNPEWGLNPTILKVEQVAVLFPGRCNADSQDYPTALERAANLEGSLGPRTMILGILLIHASKRRDLEDVAYGSWSSTGVWPPSRGVFLQKCGAGEVKMAMKTEREKEANERRSQRREMGELGKDVLKRVICLAQAGLGSGTLDGMKVVGDEIVAAIRKDLKTAGAYLDFIDSLPNKAGKVERTKRQTKYKGTIYYNMYQVEQAAKDDVRAKEKAKQLEKEDKDKEREKKKESARVLKEAAEAIAATERQEKKAKKDEERQLKKAADDKAKAERKLKREEEKNKERQLKKAAVAKEKDEQKLKREEAKEERRLMREGGRTQEAKGCTFRDGKKRAASAMDGAEQPPQQPPAKRIAPAVKKTNRGRSTKVPERFKSS